MALSLSLWRLFGVQQDLWRIVWRLVYLSSLNDEKATASESMVAP